MPTDFPWAQLACIVGSILLSGAVHHYFKKWLERKLYQARVHRLVKAQQKVWYSGRV